MPKQYELLASEFQFGDIVIVGDYGLAQRIKYLQFKEITGEWCPENMIPFILKDGGCIAIPVDAKIVIREID